MLTYPGTGSQNAGFLITSLCHSLDHALSVAPLLEQSLNVAREAAAPVVALEHRLIDLVRVEHVGHLLLGRLYGLIGHHNISDV